MSMFDYIKFNGTLPGDLYDKLPWLKDEIFQTKDTPSQCMTTYIIDTNDNQLWEEQITGHWEEGSDEKVDFLGRLGHYVVDKTEIVQCNYSGCIEFYTSYHPEDEEKDWEKPHKYDCGWVEYTSMFDKGRLMYTELKEHKEPVFITPEERQRREEEWAKSRAEMKQRIIKNRKERPNEEQKLLDEIWNQYCVEDSVALAEFIAVKLVDYRREQGIHEE